MTKTLVEKSESLVAMPSWSPSRLESIEACPCFEYVQEMEATDTAATEGTLLHEAAQKGDLSILENDEQKAEVQMALDYLQGVLAGYGSRVKEVQKEQQIRIGILRRNGYMDVMVHLQPECRQIDILDYKFGRKPVTPADKNLQMLTYSLGVFDAHEDVESVRVHIVAPRSKEVSDHMYVRADIPMMQMRVRRALDTFFDPFKKPCSKNHDLCEKCANAARCPEMAGTALALAQVLGLPMPSDLNLTEDSKATPEDRAKCQVLALAMISWAEQVKRANTAYVMSGRDIPWFGMHSRGGSFGITDVPAARQALKANGFTDDDIIAASGKPNFKKLCDIYIGRTGAAKGEAVEAVKSFIGAAGDVGGSAQWLQRECKLPWEELGPGTQALLTKAPEVDTGSQK